MEFQVVVALKTPGLASDTDCMNLYPFHYWSIFCALIGKLASLRLVLCSLWCVSDTRKVTAPLPS